MSTLKQYTGSLFPYGFLVIGLLGLTYSLCQANWIVTAGLIIIPFAILFVSAIVIKPSLGLFTVLVLSYFLNTITKYTNIEGLSVILDSLLLFTLVCIVIGRITQKTYPWERIQNKLFYLSFVWLAYSALELLNPSAMFSAWFYSRGIVYYFMFTVLLTTLLLSRVKDIKRFLFILSLLTLVAIGKVFWQKYIGFDTWELRWLESGGAVTHIIASGIRYFSIFSDAGNFGSNMGFALVAFMILSFYTQNRFSRIYYLTVSLLSGYAMALSGTRGAMIVPFGGLVLFIVLNKNIRQIVIGGLLLLVLYIFFAHTYILESNSQISRMRTAFRPSKDASYNVRIDNQKRLASYMKNKPFGEGVGLAGVDSRRFSYRFTTNIPTDSHYVSMWVQFGIVGLCLHIGILLFVVFYGGYLILFKIQNKELKGMLIAMNCGLFGIMLSAYGNNFFFQYPTVYIVYICQTFLVLGKSYDQELINSNQTNTIAIKS